MHSPNYAKAITPTDRSDRDSIRNLGYAAIRVRVTTSDLQGVGERLATSACRGARTERPQTLAKPACRQAINCPPLAVSVEPVMKPASSAARNTTARPISSGSPRRPTGICGRMFFAITSGLIAFTISVAM